MPSPKIKFTSGRFVDQTYGLLIQATKKKPLLFHRRNGKIATRGRWMHIETGVFYSMERSEMRRLYIDRAASETRRLYTDDAKTTLHG